MEIFSYSQYQRPTPKEAVSEVLSRLGPIKLSVARLDEKRDAKLSIILIAVSYTHLDVYKRQLVHGKPGSLY